jgi:hypothetical protein
VDLALQRLGRGSQSGASGSTQRGRVDPDAYAVLTRQQI